MLEAVLSDVGGGIRAMSEAVSERCRRRCLSDVGGDIRAMSEAEIIEPSVMCCIIHVASLPVVSH